MGTYYEWIKTLSIDRMAKLLARVSENPCALCDAELCRKDYPCAYGWRIWLNKEKQELKRRKV